MTAPVRASWSDLDVRAVDTARVLAADAVEKVGNGHPGTAISLAPVAYLLYQDVLRHDPADPHWLGRDRFVLSAGHSSLTQYIQLFLGGFGLELADLQALRTWGSKTPGHPEWRHTAGVEITTGPLGQGIASAVGMAMAARRERGLLDPDAAPGTSPFDHRVVVIAGDGDLQEGVSGEASSLAGTQELGDLLVIWDDNHISIEGDTKIAFGEDVLARYAAYGWHTQLVDWTATGQYVEDVDALAAAIEAAKADPRPSFIAVRTLIAWPTPGKTGDHSAHGSKLGTDAIRGLKELVGLDPDRTFQVDEDVLAHTRSLATRAAADRAAWQTGFDAWAAANPERKQLLDRLVAKELPAGWTDALPVFPAGKAVATRSASGTVLSALADELPELWGGSADLAGSNNTTMAGVPSFLPTDRSSHDFAGTPYGRTLHFGIREHAMGAILSGIALHGLTRPYGGTFFQFADYMRGAVRLAALMGTDPIYVWTHDSIGLGEDGPTHQPVEHLAAYRAIPGLAIVRPADANETAAAWAATLTRHDGPTGLVLTRQNVPTVPRGTDGYATTDGVARGAYTLLDTDGTPDVLLIATGSEVQLAVTARQTLADQGINARVVSAPCLEWFAEQDQSYQDAVLPPQVTARVSVEAGIAMPWYKILGAHGQAVSLEHFGASASSEVLYEKFGITADAVVAAAHRTLASVRGEAPQAAAPGVPTATGTGDLPG
ncbi:transketolase [Cellulomonas citrea]|uniref:transketolase n=1 Tax=Cellulomonas citrea TaxID=1909423 RepID=UPI0019165D2B|nr:transketolase [Cellulomonas citrea]